MYQRLFASVLIAMVLISPLFVAYSQAQEAGAVSFGASEWGIYDDERIVTGSIEYELPTLEGFYGLNPTLLTMFRKDEFYIAVGANKYFYKYKNIDIALGFSAGYVNNSDFLGYDLEFYTRFIARYPLSETHTLKLEIGHISNGGFGDTNPGSENIGLSIAFAL